MMKTLYIDRREAELHVDRQRLVVNKGDLHIPLSIPLKQISRLIVNTSVTLSVRDIALLAEHGITTLIINARKGNFALVSGDYHKDASHRLRQYQAVCSAQLSLNFSQELVRAKLSTQYGALQQAITQRLDLRLPLLKASDFLHDRLEVTCDSIESLRGIEGACAASYFAGYRQLFAPALAFNERNRRPPQDPVNVVLSLSYTLLHVDAVRSLTVAGFDPALGFYHAPYHGRESLACDVVELMRAHVDVWVWRLFAEGILRQEYFSYESQGDRPCLLGKQGREVFYIEYEKKACLWRRQLRRIAYLWRQRLSRAIPNVEVHHDELC
ncbi:MAG: CRISPR-associated endonuclease Cas1 [Pseudomonadales bacterium]|nr:CRISPR-associated endonuclease Cas1 [Pseudomonadales bacterium]